MENNQLYYEDFVQYGNAGYKQGLIYYCCDLSVNKFIVVIADFIHEEDSIIKSFEVLEDAISFYEDNLSIIVDNKLKKLTAKRNKLNREIATLKKADLSN